MKHTIKITLYLILLFFVAQIVGILIINQYIDQEQLQQGTITFTDLPYDIDRPQVKEATSFTLIILAILIGTIFLLTLIKFKKVKFWKLWFFLSVLITLSIALSAFINSKLAFFISLIIAYIKVYKPNFIVHNISELFIYGGLAAIFVPILNVKSAFILLALISLYDMYAVWKSKHMVKLAKFQTKSNVFAGLSVPYPLDKKDKILKKPTKNSKNLITRKMAILGGGDIGFPLLFTGAILKDLLLIHPLQTALTISLILPLTVTISLTILFFKGKPHKFYPAMPFLSMGCLVGFILLKLLNFL